MPNVPYFSLPDALTSREQGIISLVSVGLRNKEIARELNISEGTVKLHLHNIFRKTRVTNRTALTALMHGYALRDAVYGLSSP